MGNRFAAPIALELDSGEPAAPPVGELLIYGRDIAGRAMPKVLGPSGLDAMLQRSLADVLVQAWLPGNSAAIQALCGAVTNVGTISHPALADTNLKTRTNRFVNTSAATAGSLASSRPARVECSRNGGFYYVFRGGLETLVTGLRFFAGLIDTAASAPTNVDPLTSTAGAKVGLAINVETGNLNLIHNTSGAAPTVIALGANFPVNTTNVYELVLYSAPGAASIGYIVRNKTNGIEVSGTLTTNLPAAASFMGRQVWACNNATAAACAWWAARCLVETDY